MLRKLVAVAALALVAPVSAPGIAQAQGLNEVTVIDQRGDMWRVPEEGRPVAAPSQQRGDIRRATIRHGQHVITVNTKFSELSRKPQFYDLTVRLRTSAGMRREVNLVAGQFGRTRLWGGTVEVDRPGGRAVTCATAHSIDYSNNVIRLQVPRSCLGDPRWVQASVLSTGLYGRPVATNFIDTAHNAQHRIKRLEPTPARTRVIRLLSRK